jgi:pyruvate/2-oxoglutarate dehydrogenase complex dihydrolipoamide dehydrogenase (E3) component
MFKKYTHDIIVIGAGSGGLTCAVFMQQQGFNVLLVDKAADTFGGDCLNYGCIPSKALLHAANSIHSADQSSTFRQQQHGDVDVKKVMTYVKERQAIVRLHENPEYFKDLGIDIAIGEARFSGRHHVAVGDTTFTARHIVVATGSRPRDINLPGLDTLPHFTNETIFDIQTLPKQFVFIGGGPINIELGQAFSRLGSNVTILQSSDRIINKEDEEVSVIMRSLLEKEGMTIHTGVTINKVENGTVIISGPDGSPHTIPADAVFVGIGRIPNLEHLELSKGGIATDDRGSVKLDRYLQTTNKSIVVIGDAAGRHMFTHAAELQAQAVLNNFFSPFKKPYTSTSMAWTTFTDPEVATFGQTRQELDANNTPYENVTVQLTEDDKAITEDATDGFLRLYVSKKGTLLGGTMVGHRAGEITSELILMMYLGLKLKSVLNKPFPYPIGSRVIQTAARQYAAKRRESPAGKRLLKFLYH